ELYHTTISKHSAHLPILMPLFYEVGASLFGLLRAGIVKASILSIKNAQWAVDMVSQEPELILTELKQSTENEITDIWNFIPYHTQEKLIAEANNYLIKLASNCAKEKPETKYYHQKISYMYSTMQTAHYKYLLMHTIVTQDKIQTDNNG